MRTSDGGQLAVLGFDWIASIAVAVGLVFAAMESGIALDSSFGLYLWLSTHFYFLLTVPFFGGRTIGMLLFNKTVLADGREQSFLLNSLRASVHLIITLIGLEVLIFTYRYSFDYFFDFSMHDLPRRK
ncbi:MAG: hypothetical protein JJ850_11255 [Kordiimonadaceae bacterium]|nr:hypothetical protein [Kordiimonadaceae bacterium]MBO6568836.1 hypothetical protein [Kordiimonadaceae bacterium]MBO6965189.1 hypothetical protein [Kordiimonadaceae bacterium]